MVRKANTISAELSQTYAGRYAKFDQLNRGLLIAALVFSLLSRWLPYRIGQLLFIVFSDG